MLSFEEGNNFSSEGELDLDLPVTAGKKKISNRIYESSGEGSDNDNTNVNDDDQSSDGNIVDSELENSQSSRVVKKTSNKSKKKQFISRDYIDNSDFDDNPLTLEEIARAAESDSDSERESVDEDGQRVIRVRGSKKKRVNKEEFVKASEDFKSILKLMPYDDSETESEREDDYAYDNEHKNGSQSRTSSAGNIQKIKKPKETLKNVLKESEALLRRSIPVELEVQVSKPKSLDLILNEALAANSKTPTEAKKRVVDEKRRIQRMKLEKLLGPERMAALIKDEPKIGHVKLDEAVEIEIEHFDEKANEGDEIAKEIYKVKLTDLPDKHFDGQKKKIDGSVSGYKAYMQCQKKSSIELLNKQLQEKIRAQSNAKLLHHQRAHAAHIAAKRAKAEEKERKRKEMEVKKERELREKKERQAEGGELFKKEKYDEYSGIERPKRFAVVVDDDGLDDAGEFGEFEKKKPTRIILSDDEEGDGEDGDFEELLNLGTDSESEGLPGVNEAIEDRMVADGEDGLSALLSGKFTEDQIDDEGDDSDDVNTSSTIKTTANVRVTPRIKSEFIDDEASDEDEEKENDEVDEEALQEEMRESNFIVDSEESEVDATELRAFANERDKKADREAEKKLMTRLGRHLNEEDEELINSLENKYGLVGEQGGVSSNKRSLQHSLDEDIRNLLDPIEQKKRKLAALGSLNILNRRRVIEAASEEFQFKKVANGVSDCSSDYYDEDDSDSDASDEEEDFGGYYEEVESGLQSKVEEMLDEEMLDGEEVQVQASESLMIHLESISGVDNAKKEINFSTIDSADSYNNTSNTNNIIPAKTRSMAVPSVDAKLKSRLLALQQENDDIASGNATNDKFKGFSISKK